MADTNTGTIIYFYGHYYIVVFWLNDYKFFITFWKVKMTIFKWKKHSLSTFSLKKSSNMFKLIYYMTHKG